MTNQSQATCTLCGLLCSLDQPTQWGDVRTCSRRSAWMAPVPTSRAQPRDSEPPPSASSLADSIHRLLSHAQRSLIWLDGADVNTTRAAVELARVSGATVYVPATTGQAIVQRVMCRDGWYGTSLADMRAQRLDYYPRRSVARRGTVAARAVYSLHPPSRLAAMVASLGSASVGVEAGWSLAR